MAYRVLQFTSTIPAGTALASPVTLPLALDNWVIESVDLEVPPGPAGLMGFYVANNGIPWIPYGTLPWLVWDDVQQSWFFTDQPSGSGWSIVGYNTGVFPHAVKSRWHVNLTPAGSAQVSTPSVTVVSGAAELTPVVL